MANLDHLPVEILYDIHLLSLSEHLPAVNRYLHAVLSRPTVNRAARWLIRKYHQPSPAPPIRSFLGKALECAVCDLQVVLEVERIWATEMSAHDSPGDPAHDSPGDPAHDSPGHPHDSHRTRPLTNSQPLTCPLLPKRLFRHRRPISETLAAPISPLLQHLFNVYAPSPNSHRGYPLCRAVMYSDIPLIEYLLTKGANPAEKDYLAVQIAFSKKDMRIIRLLIDGPEGARPTDGPRDGGRGDAGGDDDGPRAPPSTGSKRKRDDVQAPADARPESSSNKRQRYTSSSRRQTTTTRLLLTQPLVDSVVSRGSPEMIQYIIQERGYMPSLKAIVKLK